LENNLFIFNTLGLSGGWVYKKDRFIHPKIHEFLNKNNVKEYHAKSLLN